MRSKLPLPLNKWMIYGAVVISITLAVLWLGVFLAFRPKPGTLRQPTAIFTVIPALTSTPTLTSEQMLTPSPTAIGYISPEGITIGAFVQITGTEGAGLRIRSGAGTDQQPLFVGLDAEVFRIKDGPKDADGFTWWFLEAPYDSKRAGWAASKYLQMVAPPQ
jgi:hypothetical protein